MRRVLILLAILVAPVFAQRVITTVAGADWLFPGDGRPALNAPINGTTSGLDVAVDRNGNYYLCDPGNSMVMRVGADGIINVIAGNGINYISGDGGLAVNASLAQPISVAVDSIGNVYIGEFGGDIRRVTPDGIITTIAGTGTSGFSGDNGLATQAQMYQPYGLAVDSGGNIYVADSFNNRIRKITPNGIISTIAGNGTPDSTGDGGPASAATVNAPTRLTVDSVGNLYFVESSLFTSNVNIRVRKIDTKGIISAVAGGGLDFRDGIAATSAALGPLAVTVDGAGNVYVTDFFSQGIRKIDTKGIIRTIAGGTGNSGFAGDGGPAIQALFGFQTYPALAMDSSGILYLSDELNNRIRRITTDGNVNTVAGNGLYHFSGDGGPASSATLDAPLGIATDPAGNLYLSEGTLNLIRKITPDGRISIFAGNGVAGGSGDGGPATSASVYFPTYVTFFNGFVLFSESYGCRVRYVDKNGIIQTFAGGDACESSGDGGQAALAGLRGPQGIDVDPAGEVAIAENQGHRIRLVATDGTIFTLAGDGNPAFAGENVSSLKSEINSPAGVRWAPDGSLYFCDAGNNRVRRIDGTTLNITTIAGTGTADYTGDGGKANQATLNNPLGLNFDSAGNLYIADTGNRVIRMVTPVGTISTVVGSFTSKNYGDGILATDAGLGIINDLLIIPSGIMYLSDSFFNRIREVLVAPPTFQLTPTTLAFTAPAGSTASDQNIVVAGSISGLQFTTSSDSPWLQASPATGVMPSSVRVTVNPSKLAAGSNRGTITITAPNARPTTQTIQVTLTTTAPGAPSLSAKPTSLTFSYVQGSPAIAKSISVSNLGGGSLNFTAVAATNSGGSWLRVSPGSGTAAAFASTPVNITADPTAVGATGTFSGTVTLASTNPVQSIVIPVTMTVTSVQQTILIPQSGLTFFAVQGGGAPPPQFFSVLNTGRGQMQFSTTPATLSGGSWLATFPANGLSDANSPLVPQVRIDVNPTGLTAGVYYGTVQVTSPTANNTPQFVSVVLNILTPGSKVGPIVQPTGLIFTGVAGGSSPSSQIVTVQNTDNAAISFVSGRVTLDGANWFTSLPASAVVTQTQPARIVIQPQIDGLAAGVYRGTLTLSFTDGTTRTIALVLVLIPSGSTLPHENQLQASPAGCLPKTLAPVFTQVSSGFSLPVGFPGQVAVKVVDNCANPMTTGIVTVSFSNGDSPIPLFSLKDGNWAGTWTPLHLTSTVVVTADASIPEQNNISGQITARGSLQANDQAPVVGCADPCAGGAVVNGASFAPQAPLAPGSLVSIFGNNLSQGQEAFLSLPLPFSLAGSSIVIGGQQAPLLFASNGQVNAMVPFGLAVNTSQQVIASRGTAISVPKSITLAPAAPGIFTLTAAGQGAIVDGANVADATHPAKAGDVITIYCTGLGEVDHPVQSGSPASLTVLSNTLNKATATVGGAPAQVLFSGLTPGSVGLYQVNAVVPSVAVGNQVPVTITVAGQTSPPATIAVH
jgi:trimeric autotransporter adhesin